MKPSSHRDRAFALLLVLGGLVLVVIMVLAFLHSTTTELKSSKVYADGGSVQRLSDAAVNVVIGQIRDATKSRDATGHALAWASQPGMIRTYNDSGSPAGYYKLYSSGTMSGAGAFNPAAPSETVPASWDSDSAFYTDLNEPMSGHYPIADPGAIKKVEGFAIDSSVGAVAGKANPLPMPVQWLYMLADGTLVAPAGSGSSAIVAGATATNPIMARVAFWTDDETSKVNINTASEGTYWDLPRVNSLADVALSINQPALNEFQRYAGHPATTSLSPVLGWKLPMTGKDGVYTYDQLQPYYSLTPRVAAGGSKAGTISSDIVSNEENKIKLDKDRLYATVDELAFRPDRTPISSASIPLTAEDIDKTRFFLTTASRAPDVNLFNRPRVIAWPIGSQTDANHRTVWDNAIAFCGTIGGRPFYFQRNDPDDPESDLNLGNNQNLLSYLRTLTTSWIPGFGGSFATKYPDDRDQILTEIFDYIRCTNLCDNNGKEDGSFASFTNRKVTVAGSGKGQVVPIYNASWGTRGFGRFSTLSEAAFVFIDGSDDYVAGNPDAVPPIPGQAATKLQMRAALLLELFDPSLGYPVKLGNYQIKVSGLEAFEWPDGSPMFVAVNPLGFSHKAVTLGYAPVEHTRDSGGNEGFRALFARNTSNTLISTLSGVLPVGGTFLFKGGPVTVEFQNKLGTTVQTINLYFPPATIPLPRAVDSTGTHISGTNASTNFQDFDPGGSGRFSSLSPGPNGAWISQFDTVRSLSARDGDYRLIAGRRTISDSGAGDDLFAPLTSAISPLADYYSPTVSLSHTLREARGDPFFGAYRGSLIKDAPYYRTTLAANNLLPNPGTNANSNMLYPKGKTGGGLSVLCGNQDLSYNGVALGKHGGFVAGDVPGDWDNGFGDIQDGPYINKPDEGVVYKPGKGADNGPYYDRANMSPAVDVGGSLFSPNRQIPSAGMFGSLSTGVRANRPWQTLLFRPDPSGRHPGSKDRKGDGSQLTGAPPDHLLLDLFQMPIVEPYPISEPLSTAGRVNMNYQIVPFTYITRSTGIRAVMKSERLLAVDNNGTIQDANKGTTAVDYKQNAIPAGASSSKVSTVDWRKDIDLEETLKGFAQRFSTGEVFRSASEICEIPLVPVGDGNTYAAVSSSSTDFWFTKYPLSGDNSREKPYANIYPRLTTKSNTYSVHYRVQSLQKSKQRANSAPTEFDPSRGDKISGEFRGYSLIERYVDANDKSMPDFSTAALDDAASDIDSYYRFRITRSKQFAPR